MPSYFRITCTNPLNRSALDRDATRNLLETAVNNRVGPRPHVPNERLRYMRIGDARVSKADGSQSLDLQRDALWAEGVDAGNVYHDVASGVRDDRPGLDRS